MAEEGGREGGGTAAGLWGVRLVCLCGVELAMCIFWRRDTGIPLLTSHAG